MSQEEGDQAEFQSRPRAPAARTRRAAAGAAERSEIVFSLFNADGTEGAKGHHNIERVFNTQLQIPQSHGRSQWVVADIMQIVETKRHRASKSFPADRGYRVFESLDPKLKGHGSVAVIVGESLMDVTEELQVPTPSGNTLWLAVHTARGLVVVATV